MVIMQTVLGFLIIMLSISIVFTHMCQFTFTLLPCAQYAQRVMHSLSFVCVCVGHLHINFTSQISLQKPILLTYPLYYVARDALLGLLSHTESDIPHVSILKIIPRGSWGFPNITVRKRK